MGHSLMAIKGTAIVVGIISAWIAGFVTPDAGDYVQYGYYGEPLGSPMSHAVLLGVAIASGIWAWTL